MSTQLNSGVYCIYNIVTHKFYIGSSITLKERMRRHYLDLKGNRHHIKYLQSSWNKRGEKDFIFRVLRTCPPEQCISLEQYFINAINPEYNCREIADKPLGTKRSLETKKKMSNYAKIRSRHKFYKPVVKICPVTKQILDEYKSVKEAGEMNNIRPKYVSAVLKNKRSKTGGFNWDYKK